MNDLELDVLLDRWSERIEDRAPIEDVRRTKECLRFDEIAKLVRNEGKEALQQRQNHIPQCSWCKSALVKVVSLLESDVSAVYNSQGALQYPQAAAASFKEDQSPFAVGLGTYVGNWIRGQAVPMEADTPAYFDAQGTLHIELQGLPQEGVMRASLLVSGTPMSIGMGNVVDGKLTILRPMPEFEVHSVRLPAELVECVPVR